MAPASSARGTVNRTRTASTGPRTRQSAAIRRSRRPSRQPVKLRRNIAIDTRAGGRILDLSREPDAAIRLPRGKADGRYECLACGKKLIFTGPVTASDFTPRFRHESTTGTDRCTAPAAHQQHIAEDLAVVLDLRDVLVRAWPTAHLAVETCRRLAHTPSPLPPAIVLRHGEQTIVIERPRRPLTSTTVQERLAAVRARHGKAAQHWWFFDPDTPLHYSSCGTVNIRLFGKRATHSKVRPTPIQRQITGAGATVCWLGRDTVLIPYGAHPFTYTAKPGEDWSATMASWSQDWHLSGPLPAANAAWWGLVPTPLHSLTRGSKSFAPTLALQIMDTLRRAEAGREGYRRRLAREQHQRLHHRPGPAQTPLDATVQTSNSQDTEAAVGGSVTAPASSTPAAGVETLPAPAHPAFPPAAPPGRSRWTWRRRLRIRLRTPWRNRSKVS